FCFLPQFVFSLKEGDCEVCVKAVEKLQNRLTDAEKSDASLIEKQFIEMCKSSKGKENKFCYYLGGLEDSATKTLKELTTPMTYGLPALKICERLNKRDSQICELREEKKIDITKVDLKKLRVRDLKKVLSDWEETCDGCIEKAEFIRRIEELKPKYIKEDL
ncbi:mesencephalic astrocyte-derived neurotrophic factor-like protein, partial [Leptotrombidium deliense]